MSDREMNAPEQELSIEHLLEAHSEDGEIAVSNVADAITAAENTLTTTWLLDAKGIRVAAIVPSGIAQAGLHVLKQA